MTPYCARALWYTLEKRRVEYHLWKGGFLSYMFIQVTLLPIPTPEELRRVRQLVEDTDMLTSNYSNLESATATRV